MSRSSPIDGGPVIPRSSPGYVPSAAEQPHSQALFRLQQAIITTVSAEVASATERPVVLAETLGSLELGALEWCEDASPRRKVSAGITSRALRWWMRSGVTRTCACRAAR